MPVVGDWNGSGSTKIGVYYSGFWTLDYNGNGSSDSQDINTGFGGNAGDVPIVGTWTITPGVGTKIAAPSSLQSNLGNIPIDLYTSNTDVSSAPYPYPKICPAGGPLRSCYQKIFQYLRSQNVTGVRFQFGLCGNPGFYSTALTNCGQNWTAVGLSTNWVTNLKAFYLDLYNAGIRNITPTPSHGDYVSGSFDPSTTPLTVYRATTPGPGTNGNPMFCGMSPTITRFNATEPFGRRACHSSSPYFCDSAHGENCNSSCEKDYDLPVDDHLNGWNCSPANPIFVGWNNLNNVIKETIQSAVDTPSAGARGLTVFEVDLENEIDITEYPVEARYILDNTNTNTGNPASFQEISNYMGSSGYDSRRVTYSAYDTRPSVPGYNGAVDFYSGYGRITALSSLFAAIGGGPIGVPINNNVTNGLYSGGSFLQGSPALPQAFTQPNIIDVHMYPCVIDTAPGPNNGYCLRGSSTPQVMTEAQLPLSDINAFITAHNQQGSLFMFGEVHSNSDGGYADIPNVQYSSDSSRKGGTCELRASVSQLNGGNAPSLVVAGNSSTLSGHNSVFRPWINVPQGDGCFVYPVNYQLNIYNSGPYRPSN